MQGKSTCPTCGLSFDQPPHAVQRRTYCSPRCRWTAKHGPPVIEISDDGLTARIPIYRRDGTIRTHFLIDAADVDSVTRWRWALAKGYVIRVEYLGGGAKHKRLTSIYLHRELLGLTPGDGLEGDHINRNILDNRRGNLRKTTHAGNHQNRGATRDTSSRFRGVYWDLRRSKWQAQIKIDGKVTHLGSFDDEVEAAEAARTARARLMPYATD